MAHDQLVDTKPFKTKPEGEAWVKDQKKKYGGSTGVLRHSVTPLLDDPVYNWEYSLYIRGTQK